MSREVEILNCQIKSTQLEFYDKYIDSQNIMTLYLFLEGSGWGCGFGGVVVDKTNTGDFLKKSIKGILTCLKIPTWENLPNTFIRAEVKGIGQGIDKIGHLIEDRWFTFQNSELLINGNEVII